MRLVAREITLMCDKRLLPKRKNKLFKIVDVCKQRRISLVSSYYLRNRHHILWIGVCTLKKDLLQSHKNSAKESSEKCSSIAIFVFNWIISKGLQHFGFLKALNWIAKQMKTCTYICSKTVSCRAVWIWESLWIRAILQGHFPCLTHRVKMSSQQMSSVESYWELLHKRNEEFAAVFSRSILWLFRQTHQDHKPLINFYIWH